MEDFMKNRFLKNFNVKSFETSLVESIEDFEAKIKGEKPINKKELSSIISKYNDIRFVDTSEITDFSYLFADSTYAVLDLSRWDFSNATNLSSMFWDSKELEYLDLGEVDFSKVENMYSMFRDCKNLPVIDLSNWDFDSLKTAEFMFAGCKKVKELSFKDADLSNLTIVEAMFRGCSNVEKIDFSGAKFGSFITVKDMFFHCSNLKEVDVSAFDMSEVKDSSSMFCYCKSLESLDFSNSNFDKLEIVFSMFEKCENLSNLKLPKSVNAINLSTADLLFSDCVSLKTLDLSEWRVPALETTQFMFKNCAVLEELNIKNFDLSTIEKKNGMFFRTRIKDGLVLKEGTSIEDANAAELKRLRCKNPCGSFEKAYELDSDLLSLNFTDNPEDLPFDEDIKGNGMLDVFLRNGKYYLVENEGVVYILDMEDIIKLSRYGLLSLYEE